MTKARTRELGESIPPLKDHGVRHLVAARKGGIAMQSFEKTLSAGTNSIVFADEGLDDMADALYHIFVGGEITLSEAAPNTIVKADVSTRATTGFDLIDGVNTDVVHVMVVGRLAGMAPDPADV